MKFESLGLAEPLVRAVHEQGYTIPTPIQLQAIPAVLNGGDLEGGDRSKSRESLSIRQAGFPGGDPARD